MKNFWNQKNVFVTGASGFVGSWIAKTLVEQNANVVVLIRDLKKYSSLDLHKIRDKIDVVHGDLADYFVCERILNQYKSDYVFHVGAQAIVGTANSSPLSTFESNIKGTWSLLEACRKKDSIKGIVVASSDKAYGVQNDLPYTENSPLLGLFPYDASKACTDILARSYFTTYGMPIAVTRNANIYGGADLNFSRIVPQAIKALVKNEAFLIRSDGSPQRDYIYVKDIANAYLLLAQNVDKQGVKGEAFNFGTETPISVLSLFKKIAQIYGQNNPKIKILNEAKNEISKQYLSISKAKKILNWKTNYSLEDGLKETIDWYKDFLKKTK